MTMFYVYLLDDSSIDRQEPVRLGLLQPALDGVEAVLVLLEDDTIASRATAHSPILQLVRKFLDLTSEGFDAVLNFHHLG